MCGYGGYGGYSYGGYGGYIISYIYCMCSYMVVTQ